MQIPVRKMKSVKLLKSQVITIILSTCAVFVSLLVKPVLASDGRLERDADLLRNRLMHSFEERASSEQSYQTNDVVVREVPQRIQSEKKIGVEIGDSIGGGVEVVGRSSAENASGRGTVSGANGSRRDSVSGSNGLSRDSVSGSNGLSRDSVSGSTTAVDDPSVEVSAKTLKNWPRERTGLNESSGEQKILDQELREAKK